MVSYCLLLNKLFANPSLKPIAASRLRLSFSLEGKKMKTILFTWNPEKWRWDDLPQAVAEANVDGQHIDTWSCGVTKNIKPGDRAFLMRLGLPPKGIIGSGVVVSIPKEGSHWNPDRAAQGDKGYYVEILFDVLNDTPVLGEDTLSRPPLHDHDWYPMASGTSVPENIAAQLESIWSNVTGTTFVPPSNDEIRTIYLEGTRRTRLIKACERNPEARSKCVEHYGARCQVCGLAFEERYGEIGKGFIHVHHLVQMAGISSSYEVDPIQDLRPLCPNCHAMLHKRVPPYTIEELIQRMEASNK